jgi:hypothetical protein
MSALGQKRTFALQKVMSALPPKADISGRNWNVRYGPQADTFPFDLHQAAYNLRRLEIIGGLGAGGFRC